MLLIRHSWDHNHISLVRWRRDQCIIAFVTSVPIRGASRAIILVYGTERWWMTWGLQDDLEKFSHTRQPGPCFLPGRNKSWNEYYYPQNDVQKNVKIRETLKVQTDYRSYTNTKHHERSNVLLSHSTYNLIEYCHNSDDHGNHQCRSVHSIMHPELPIFTWQHQTSMIPNCVREKSILWIIHSNCIYSIADIYIHIHVHIREHQKSPSSISDHHTLRVHTRSTHGDRWKCPGPHYNPMSGSW